MSWLHIYAMSTPLIVVVLALGVVALTQWQDKRELQRVRKSK